uniref:Uncharacterized protein n=1 Tax=Aegilops tauschii subsp. strangulata TaxID=200361 RepID=A0A453LMG2_AEGTS
MKLLLLGHLPLDLKKYNQLNNLRSYYLRVVLYMSPRR